MNTGFGYADSENKALGTVGNAVSNVASGIIGIGSVQQQRAAALGAGIGGVLDLGVQGAASYYTGSSVNNLMQPLGSKTSMETSANYASTNFYG